MSESNIKVFSNDIPDDLKLFGSLAIDTEAMGLKVKRDRLCCVQICDELKNKVIVHYPSNSFNYEKSVNLKKILNDKNIQKIFHFARFDLHILRHYLNINKIENVFCTKIASKLTRTYTDRHGLKNVVNEVCKINLDKQQSSSNWGSAKLSNAQLSYAINDVLYLHEVKKYLEQMLIENNRLDLAKKAFEYLDNVVSLDMLGFEDDIFYHF